MKNYVDWVNTTNPAGEGSYDDSWINDTIDTRTRVLYDALISYDETKSIEILGWIDGRNTSVTNYANFLNTTQTNHINTKLSLSGGTMTGNISLSNSGVRLTNGTQNTAVIYHNGTGWIIRG